MFLPINSVVAKSLLGVLALGGAVGAGVGVRKLYDQSGDNSVKKRIELPYLSRWLRTQNGKDNQKWEEKLSNYSKEKVSDILSLKGKDIEAVKQICESLKSQEFEESVLAEKKKQAEEWCSTRKTVGEHLKDLRNKFLSFEDEEKEDKKWKKKFEAYKKAPDKYKDFVVVDLGNGDENKKKEGIKKMKERCKELQAQEITNDEKNLNTFKVWCMKGGDSTLVKSNRR